jgi:hypothetical protein
MGRQNNVKRVNEIIYTKDIQGLQRIELSNIDFRVTMINVYKERKDYFSIELETAKNSILEILELKRWLKNLEF